MRIMAALLLAFAPGLLAQEVKVEHHVTTVKQPDVTVSNVQVKEVHGRKAKKFERLNSDVNRLESILATTQNVNLPPSSLKSVANEANALANRIWADVHKSFRGQPNAIDAATQLRAHIRLMHKAAASGDAAGVQRHAREALPFAYRLDDLV
jgi:hypothetical protein